MTEDPHVRGYIAFLERELGTALTVEPVLVVASYCSAARLLEMDTFPLD